MDNQEQIKEIKQQLTTNIKNDKWKIMLVEEGSVCCDELQEFFYNNDLKIKVVVYRCGARKPELLEI